MSSKSILFPHDFVKPILNEDGETTNFDDTVKSLYIPVPTGQNYKILGASNIQSINSVAFQLVTNKFGYLNVYITQQIENTDQYGFQSIDEFITFVELSEWDTDIYTASVQLSPVSGARVIFEFAPADNLTECKIYKAIVSGKGN